MAQDFNFAEFEQVNEAIALESLTGLPSTYIRMDNTDYAFVQYVHQMIHRMRQREVEAENEVGDNNEPGQLLPSPQEAEQQARRLQIRNIHVHSDMESAVSSSIPRHTMDNDSSSQERIVSQNSNHEEAEDFRPV